MLDKPIIYRNPNSHKGDTSRELLSMWHESGYCRLRDCESTLSWWNEEGDILLYEFNQEPHVQVPSKESVKLGLFGNYKPEEWGLHWIFWARRPRVLEDKIQEGLLNYHKKDIKSIFVGNYENIIQKNNRTKQDWPSAIGLFAMTNGPKHKYSQHEYLQLVSRSRYGLCLAGYGNKCNREVECMGLGTVPLVAPEVDMKYYDAPEEGVHYLRVSSPEDVNEIVSQQSEAEWKRMSDNCVDWWNRNCSRKGSFETTVRIIEENYEQSN